MQIDRKLSIAENVVWGAVGVFAGLAIADVSASEAGLFAWQTLVAGILAVAAAAMTIFQMERTDERAQRRHEELVKLSLRADKLKVERAAAVADAFRRYGGQITGYAAEIRTANKLTMMERQPVFAGAGNLRNSAWLLRALATDDVIRGSAQLFGPKLTITIGALREHLEDLLQIDDAQQIDSYLSRVPALAFDDTAKSEKIALFVGSAEGTALCAKEIAGLLEELAQEYR